MEKPVASLEIGSSYIKLIVGYVLDNRIDVLYADKKPLPVGAVEGGFIKDFDKVISILHEFRTLYLLATKSKINIEDVVLVLPSIGVEVFQNVKTTNVISESGRVEKIDISNAFSLIRKDRINPNAEIVNIIPDFFKLDDGRKLSSSPMHQTSNTLTLSAKVHTIPTRLLDGYKRALAGAGLHPILYVVSAYAAATLFNTYDNFPTRYFLIDSGSNMSTISLIADGMLFSSFNFETGGDNLSIKLAEQFNISREDAEKIKLMYGVDHSVESLLIPLFESLSPEEGKKKKYYNSDVNRVIELYFSELNTQIDHTIKTIVRDQEINNGLLIPLVMIGGNTRINGLEEYFRNEYGPRYRVGYSKSIGARSIDYINCLGAIVVLIKNLNETIDDNPRIANLSRLNSPEDASSE